ncbi:MAG: AraC family transcriptional regulator [Saprospiraceae bacterium]|nr:AraC family transcriptional regulator [Saprospiraceae bacterium]
MKPVLEQVRLGAAQSILAFRYSDESFDAPWHFHPQHELTLIEESTGTKFIGDYVGPYQAGELVLLRSNLPHCWKNQLEEECQARSVVIQWEKGIFAKVPELTPLLSLLRAASRGLLFAAEEVATLITSVQQLPELKGHQLYLQLLSVLLQLSDCNYQTLSENRFMDDLPTEYSDRMSKVHDFVELNYQRKIYLKELAQLVSMSEQSFSRFFSKMMGRPFFSFLNEYRINIAGRMLVDTDWPVAQIGFACGYESLPFFHKQFNKFKGESPSRFRKRHRG